MPASILRPYITAWSKLLGVEIPPHISLFKSGPADDIRLTASECTHGRLFGVKRLSDHTRLLPYRFAGFQSSKPPPFQPIEGANTRRVSVAKALILFRYPRRLRRRPSCRNLQAPNRRFRPREFIDYPFQSHMFCLIGGVPLNRPVPSGSTQ